MSSLTATKRDANHLSLPRGADTERGYISYGSADDDFHPLFALSPMNRDKKPAITKPVLSLHVRSDSAPSELECKSHDEDDEVSPDLDTNSRFTFADDGYMTCFDDDDDDDDADTVISSVSSFPPTPTLVRARSFTIDLSSDDVHQHTVSRVSSPVPLSTHVDKHARRGLSDAVVTLVSTFWTKHIKPLTGDDRLEIAVSILHGMLKDPRCRGFLRPLYRTSREMETVSVDLLDDMAWTVRMLSRDLSEALRAKGPFLGFDGHFYAVMLQQLHETLCFYFASEYTADVRFAADALFTLQRRCGPALTSRC